jgi:hypothetical protein
VNNAQRTLRTLNDDGRSASTTAVGRADVVALLPADNKLAALFPAEFSVLFYPWFKEVSQKTMDGARRVESTKSTNRRRLVRIACIAADSMDPEAGSGI